MTRHGYIQAGSQVTLPEAEAEEWIERGHAKEIITPELGVQLAAVTEMARRRANPAKMARLDE